MGKDFKHLPRVLIAAHIGKPVGGISVYFENLLSSSLKMRLHVDFEETSRGRHSFGERGIFSIQNFVNFIENMFYFTKALFETKPNIVHIGTAHGASFIKHGLMALIAQSAGKRVVLHLHCGINALLPSLENKWGMFVLFVLSRVDGIITISKEWDKLREILPKTQIQYIPNAINLLPYLQIVRPRPGLNKCVNLLYLGHIHKDKGCFDLLEAINRVKEKTNKKFRMDFVGEFSYKEEQKNFFEILKEKGLEPFVAIHGPEYDEEKIRRLASSDIFILPSYHEGMPVSIIEAMASGMAVVGSNVGGIPEQIIHGKSGFVFEVGDIESLSDLLLHLIENPEIITSTGLSARQRAKDLFDVEKKVDMLVNFYTSLLSHSR